MTKIIPEQREQIRQKYISGEKVGDIATMYGVTHGAIGQIINSIVSLDRKYQKAMQIISYKPRR